MIHFLEYFQIWVGGNYIIYYNGLALNLTTFPVYRAVSLTLNNPKKMWRVWRRFRRFIGWFFATTFVVFDGLSGIAVPELYRPIVLIAITGAFSTFIVRNYLVEKPSVFTNFLYFFAYWACFCSILAFELYVNILVPIAEVEEDFRYNGVSSIALVLTMISLFIFLAVQINFLCHRQLERIELAKYKKMQREKKEIEGIKKQILTELGLGGKDDNCEAKGQSDLEKNGKSSKTKSSKKTI